MRLHCAILDDYNDVALKFGDWSAIDDQVDVAVFNHHIESRAELIEALQGFQIVCIIRERTAFPRDVIEALPDLRLLVTAGNRNPSVDAVALKERGITFCGTETFGAPTVGVAIGLMLELTRKIGVENARLHAGSPWQTTVGTDLHGKTLGLLGLGKLGGKIATIAHALDMKTIAWSQNLTPERCSEVGATYVSREDLFSQADIISIHVVLGQRNRGLVGRDDLARMKSTAYIVNTSRGPIIDEGALIEVLRERRIAGAGLDVFWTEPLPLDHTLRSMDNVVITPHLGYVTEENFRAYFVTMVEDIKAWLSGNPIRLVS